MKEDLSSPDSPIMSIHGDNPTGLTSGLALTDQLATSAVVQV